MTTIQIRPSKLRSTAATLRQKAKTIRVSLENVDHAIIELDSAKFAGNRATSLSARHAKSRGDLLSASKLIDMFAQELETSANVFEKADNSYGKVGPLPVSPPKILKPQPIKPGIEIANGTAPGANGTFPTPPVEHKLSPADPSKFGKLGCVDYANDRRPDLGSTQSNNGSFTDGAAANYIAKFEDKAFKTPTDVKNLNDVVAKGYAVVWEPGQQGANATYGHVAIVEEVGPDYIVVSHGGWGNPPQPTTRIPLSKLKDLWLIP